LLARLDPQIRKACGHLPNFNLVNCRRMLLARYAQLYLGSDHHGARNKSDAERRDFTQHCLDLIGARNDGEEALKNVELTLLSLLLSFAETYRPSKTQPRHPRKIEQAAAGRQLHQQPLDIDDDGDDDDDVDVVVQQEEEQDDRDDEDDEEKEEEEEDDDEDGHDLQSNERLVTYDNRKANVLDDGDDASIHETTLMDPPRRKPNQLNEQEILELTRDIPWSDESLLDDLLE
jgi:hypothetical protein